MVCFDLGGVLARIRRTWQSCALAAGVKTGLRDEELYELSDFALFDGFQLGSLATTEYLEKLSTYLGVSAGEAKAVHNAILQEPYEGTEELVQEIKSHGHATACLSNTNSLHWEILNSSAYPSIEGLDFKMVSHTIGLLKPESAVFRRFDLEADVAPEGLVYFDDHEGNVMAAKAHGWNAVLVDHLGDPAAQMREALRGLEVIR